MAMLTKSEAVAGYIRAKMIEGLGGNTLHLGTRFWRLGSYSGAPATEPVRAMAMWLDTKFGEQKAKIVVETVEELGDTATVETVKELYNSKIGFVPTKKAALVKREKTKKPAKLRLKVEKAEEMPKTSTPKAGNEEVLAAMDRMEKKLMG